MTKNQKTIRLPHLVATSLLLVAGVLLPACDQKDDINACVPTEEAACPTPIKLKGILWP